MQKDSFPRKGPRLSPSAVQAEAYRSFSTEKFWGHLTASGAHNNATAFTLTLMVTSAPAMLK